MPFLKLGDWVIATEHITCVHLRGVRAGGPESPDVARVWFASASELGYVDIVSAEDQEALRWWFTNNVTDIVAQKAAADAQAMADARELLESALSMDYEPEQSNQEAEE